MRIGIDVGPIRQSRSGIGNYCLNLLRQLIGSAPNHEFIGLAAGVSKFDLSAVGCPIPHRRLRVPTRALYWAWETLSWPKVDSVLSGVDVYHATNFFLPPTKTAKRIVTVHDLSFLVVPEHSSPKIVSPYRDGIRGFCQDADAVITDSESTKRHVLDLLEVDPQKVEAILLAAGDEFTPMSTAEASRIVREQYGIDGPILLFVSTLEPRKNVLTLLEAFQAAQGEIPHRLVLIGNAGWNSRDFLAQIDNNERISRLGYVSTSSLRAFYSVADALVFPSHHEGFGLPVLEAMQCGCPVISADNSSLPEVGGDAALYFESTDTNALAEAMRRVACDGALREKMSAKGLAQAEKFSWTRCARSTLDTYERVCLC